MTPPASRRLVGALVASLLLVTAGCAAVDVGSDSSAPVTPQLAAVTPLDDPHEWVGPSTAVLQAQQLQPLDDDSPQTLPVTVTDAQGTEVTVTDTSRILALDLYGSLARIVFELGFGESVVGRDVSSDFEEIRELPLITQSGHDLNGESILQLAPTLIITDTSLGPWDVVLQMRDAGVPVVVVDSHRDLDNVETLIGQVASALGVDERGAVLAERTQASIEAAVEAIAEVAPAEPADKLRMVFLYVRGQAGVYYMFGEGSGADSLIEALGGFDVAAEIGWEGMRPLTDEGLVAAEPDLILMMTKGLESVNGVDGLIDAVPAVGLTPAGQNKRVVDMSDTEILSFGPRSADVLDALAVAVYAPQAAQ